MSEDFSAFEDGTVLAQGVNFSQNGISYSAAEKNNASFIVKTDTSGVKYLEWNNDTKDPALQLRGTTLNLTNTTSTAVSFTFALSKDGDNPFPNFEFTLYAKKNVNADAIATQIVAIVLVFPVAMDFYLSLLVGCAYILVRSAAHSAHRR